MKEPILITGGCGYIGRYTAKALDEAGYQPVLLDDLSENTSLPWTGYPVFIGDIADADLVRDLVRSFGIRRVLHLAGKTDLEESETLPAKYWEENFLKTQRLIDAVGSVDRFVFASTCAVYAGTGMHFEDDEPNPASHYGRSKAWAERVVSRAGGICLRYFNVAGGEIDHRRLIGRLLTPGIFRGRPMRLYGHGGLMRDYIHVADVARANVKALTAQSVPPIANIGTGCGHTVYEVLEAAERVTNKTIVHEAAPSREYEAEDMIAGFRTDFIDWDCASLEEIIESCIARTPVPA